MAMALYMHEAIIWSYSSVIDKRLYASPALRVLIQE